MGSARANQITPYLSIAFAHPRLRPCPLSEFPHLQPPCCSPTLLAALLASRTTRSPSERRYTCYVMDMAVSDSRGEAVVGE